MMTLKNIIASIIFAAAGFLVIGFLLPKYEDIQSAREATGIRRTKYEERSALINNAADMEKKYQQNLDNINNLAFLIPFKKQNDQVLLGVSEMVNQSGLRLLEISMADMTQSALDQYRPTIISVRLSGDYPAFFNFLKLLEQSIRLYDLREITMGQDTATKAGLNIELKIMTFSLK